MTNDELMMPLRNLPHDTSTERPLVVSLLRGDGATPVPAGVASSLACAVTCHVLCRFLFLFILLCLSVARWRDGEREREP